MRGPLGGRVFRYGAMTPTIEHFHHASSGTLTYVVSDSETGAAAVIDPVLGFSSVTGRTDDEPVLKVQDYLRANQLEVRWILETHAHADHLSGAQILKRNVGGTVAIGRAIADVQAHFAKVFNLDLETLQRSSGFDRLLDDGESLAIGSLTLNVMATPGHTSDGVTYLIGDAAFIGDTLFSPQSGSARCDFPGGDAGVLYDSIQKILALPEATRIFLCHDYPADADSLCWQTTVAAQRADNIHVGNGIARDDFIARRGARDAVLKFPALLLPSIQVNICGGKLPDPEDNGIAYLRLPLDHL